MVKNNTCQYNIDATEYHSKIPFSISVFRTEARRLTGGIHGAVFDASKGGTPLCAANAHPCIISVSTCFQNPSSPECGSDQVI